MRRRLARAISASVIGAVVGALLISPTASAGSSAIVNDPGCTTTSLGRTDDGASGAIPLGFRVDWMGNTYDSIYVNNNGGIAFDGTFSNYNGINVETTSRDLILPLFTDLFTRTENTSSVTWGPLTNPVDGRTGYCINWVDVGHYYKQQPLYAAQLLILQRDDRAPNAVDIVFNYGYIGESAYPLEIGFSAGSDASLSKRFAGSGVTPTPFTDNGVQPLRFTSTVPVGSNYTEVAGRHIFTITTPSGDIDPCPPTLNRSEPLTRGSIDDPSGKWIVVTDGSITKTDLKSAGGTAVSKLGSTVDAFVAELTPAEARALRIENGIEIVERDGSVWASGVQDCATWGIDRIDQRALPLNQMFEYPHDGQGVDAYIVDTGVRMSHREFTGRTAAGFTAITDGNGTNDCNGHGTHVASTVAGASYGVAQGATVIPVRVLDCRGEGTYSGVIAGIEWAVQHHQGANPAVLNMSLGGSASASIDAAVEAAVADGITVVVAAGNEGSDACMVSPARAQDAITVGATASNDARTSWSNFGSCVDVFAPGSNITAADYSSISSVRTLSGTSMASPHVAGAAAVYLGLYPNATPKAVADALLEAATPDVVSDPRSVNRLLYARDFKPFVPAPDPVIVETPPAIEPMPVVETPTPADQAEQTTVSSSTPTVTVNGKKMVIAVKSTGIEPGTKALLRRGTKKIAKSSVLADGSVTFRKIKSKPGRYRVFIIGDDGVITRSKVIRVKR